MQTPLTWTRIIIIMAIAAVVTGVGVGALGTLIGLPPWLPGAALASVLGVSAAFLIQRRNAQRNLR